MNYFEMKNSFFHIIWLLFDIIIFFSHISHVHLCWLITKVSLTHRLFSQFIQFPASNIREIIISEWLIKNTWLLYWPSEEHQVWREVWSCSMNHLRSICSMNLLWVFYGDGKTEHKSTITLLLEVFIFLTLLNPLLLLFKTKL